MRSPPAPSFTPDDPLTYASAAPCVGIVSAMPAETAPLLRRTSIRERHTSDGQRFAAGRLGDTEVVLTHTGVGPRRAERGCGLLLDRYTLTHLLFVGVAGGLDPTLGPGDLLAARTLIDPAGGAAPAPDPAWLASACALPAVRGATCVTVASVAGPAAKAALWRTVSVHGPAVVDMESTVFAHAAAAHGLPFAVLRAVSDTADEPIPAVLTRCARPDGTLHRNAAIRHLLRHPLEGAALLQLHRRVRTCAARLAESALALLGRSPG